MTDALNKFQTGNYIETTALTLEKWLNDWLNRRKPHITENTNSGYETSIRYYYLPYTRQNQVIGLTLAGSRLRDQCGIDDKISL